MASVIWEAIRNYQRTGWRNQAVAMDCVGDDYTNGASSGTDNGYGSHNLSATITDSRSNTWTATSTNDPVNGLQGSLTSATASVDTIEQDPIPDAVPEDAD